MVVGQVKTDRADVLGRITQAEQPHRWRAGAVVVATT
jgi:hypothetical protein